MISRYALATASALLLLGGTAARTSAFQRSATKHARVAMPQPSSMMVATRYFAALDRGLLTHDFQTLARLYAPGVTVTESLNADRLHVRMGVEQALEFDHRNLLNWYVINARQLSPTVVLTIERASVGGPGHELAGAEPWLTVFTIRNGEIVSLIWASC